MCYTTPTLTVKHNTEQLEMLGIYCGSVALMKIADNSVFLMLVCS